MSDYLRLTNMDGKIVRVAYDSIEVIMPQTNQVCEHGKISGHEGATIYMACGARLWVRESPDFIDATVEAMYAEHIVDYDADDDEE